MIGWVLKFIIVCVCAGLAGCGGGGGGASGGGGGGPSPDPRLARLDTYEAQKLRVLGDPDAGLSAMPLTPDNVMPSGGTASFTGSATIRVELQADPLVLFGEAKVDVDFGTGSSSGSLANFFGATPQGQVENYQGEITVTGDATAQNMMLNYNGSLTAPGQTIGFDGMLETLFLGAPVVAIAASDLEAVVVHNATPQNATVIVIGEGAVMAPTNPPQIPP